MWIDMINYVILYIRIFFVSTLWYSQLTYINIQIKNFYFKINYFYENNNNILK